MLTLHSFGPGFGLPDPSPFCMKAMMLLEMAGLDFQREDADLRKAPKGKAPYLVDDGAVIADSTFIRHHLEKKYKFDFDEGLDDAQRGIAWAFEKMCEEHLYWAIVHSRWVRDDNFFAGPVRFFETVPALMRPLVVKLVRRQIRRDLRGQGFGRHSEAEIVELAGYSIASLAALLADKPYLMGDKPCGADASVHATVAGLLCEQFDTPLVRMAANHSNLVDYRDRLMEQYYPEFAGKA